MRLLFLFCSLSLIAQIFPSSSGSSVTSVTAGTGLSGGGTGAVTVNAAVNTRTRAFGAMFVSATAGTTYYFTVPFTCTISAWNIAVDAGTATVDIWKIATGTAVPTVTNTITASAIPAISTGTAIHSTTLTGWTTSVAQNDIFGVNLKVVATATYVNLTIECAQ